MNELTKSLEALENAADELLKKSNSDKEDIKPSDVSEDSADDKGDDKDDSKDDKDNVEKGGEFCKPDGDNLKKSDESEDDGEVKKSLETFQEGVDEQFKADEDISKGVDTSEFQAALVTSVVKALGEIQWDLYKSQKDDVKVNDILAKSLQAVITSNTSLKAENDKLSRRVDKLEKSMEHGFTSVLNALDDMSTQPAHLRKSVGSISVHDKDFNKSINGNDADSFASLSKSQVMSVLNTELYSGNTIVTPSDIISYESGAPLRPELQSLVMNKCK